MQKIDSLNLEYEAVKNFCTALGVQVDLIPSDGWDHDKIPFDGLLYKRGDSYIIKVMDVPEKADILAHEVGHMFIGCQKEGDCLKRRDKKLEAAADAAGEMLLNYIRYSIMKKLIP